MESLEVGEPGLDDVFRDISLLIAFSLGGCPVPPSSTESGGCWTAGGNKGCAEGEAGEAGAGCTTREPTSMGAWQTWRKEPCEFVRQNSLETGKSCLSWKQFRQVLGKEMQESGLGNE